MAGKEAPMIDLDLVLRSLCRKYSLDPAVPQRLMSNNNFVFALDDSLIAKFPKSADRDEVIRKEAEICGQLHASGLQVPRIEEIAAIEGATCVLYERFAGDPAGGPDTSRPEQWEACGVFIRNLFEKRDRFRGLEGSLFPDNLNKIEKNLSKFELLDDELSSALKHMIAVLEEEAFRSFTHADYGPSQVLFDPDMNMRVIDWERSSSGNPIYSAGRFCAMIAEYIKGPKDEYIAAFKAGFCSGELSGLDEQIELMMSLSDLSDIQWKLVCGEDNNRHAHRLYKKVRNRLGLSSS